MSRIVMAISLLSSLVGFGSPTKANSAALHTMYMEGETVAYTAADYVQDGLVTLLDAIENVGYGEHDSESSIWVDLISGIRLSFPEGIAVWHDKYLVIQDNTTRSCVMPYTIKKFYDSGAISIYVTHEIIDLESSNRSGFCLGRNIGGGYSSGLAWGKMNISNSVASYNDAYATSYPNYPKGVTLSESKAFVECVGYINPTDETHAYGWTSLNLDIKRVWDRSEGYVSWLYNEARNYEARGFYIGGSNEKWMSILIYDRILTDEERKWNYKVSKARFGL